MRERRREKKAVVVGVFFSHGHKRETMRKGGEKIERIIKTIEHTWRYFSENARVLTFERESCGEQYIIRLSRHKLW